MAMISGTSYITSPELCFIGPITAESMLKKTSALGREVIDSCLIYLALPPLPQPRDMHLSPSGGEDEEAKKTPDESETFVAAVKNYEDMYKNTMNASWVAPEDKAKLSAENTQVQTMVDVAGLAKDTSGQK